MNAHILRQPFLQNPPAMPPPGMLAPGSAPPQQRIMQQQQQQQPHRIMRPGPPMGTPFPQQQQQPQNPPLRRVPSQSQMATGGMSILNPQQLAMQQQQLRQMHQMQRPQQPPQMPPRQPMMQPPQANPVMSSLSQPPSMAMPFPNPQQMSPRQPRASITPDNAMGFINYPYSPGAQRMPNAPFQFAQSSDMPERGPFPTPAQQLQMSSNSDPFVTGPSFAIQPPRSASQNPHVMHTPQRRTPQPQQHRGTPQPVPSPMQAAPSNEHPQMQQPRPHSQPQIPPPHVRPSTPRGQTPRSVQVPLPPGATMAPPGRQHIPNGPPAIIPPPPPPTQGPQRQPPTPGAPEPFGPPPNAVRAPHMNAGPLNMNPPRQPISPVESIPPGAALTRFLQLSAILAIEDKNKLQQQYWTDLIKEYFAPKASFRFQLWKTEDRKEAKYFDIGALILPRFFLATTQAGVTSMSWVVDGARERKLAQGAYQIETAHAEWVYRFSNGYRVALKGGLSVTFEASVLRPASAPPSAPVNPDDVKLLITAFDMNVNEYEKYIKVESILGERMREDVMPVPVPVRYPGAPDPPVNSTQAMVEEAERRRRCGEEPRVHIARAVIPGEPVNAFGIPQATMRCLELAESVGAMSDLIEYAHVNKLGPLVALEKFAEDLRRHGFKEMPDWVKAPFNFPRYENYVQDESNDSAKRYDMNNPHPGYPGGGPPPPPQNPGNASGSGMSGQGQQQQQQQPQQRQNPQGPPPLPPNMAPGQQPGRQQQQQQQPPFPTQQNSIIPPPPQQQHHTPLMYQPAPPSVMNPPGGNNAIAIANNNNNNSLNLNNSVGVLHNTTMTNGATTPAVIPPPQNATIASPGTQSSSSANSPQKQHRSIPQQQQQQQNANASGSGSGAAGGQQNNNNINNINNTNSASAAASSPSGSTSAGTPLVAHTSLKRKQGASELGGGGAGAGGGGGGVTASPTMGTAEGGAVGAKRNTRKRGRTSTAG